jgi:N-acetylmuramoyl-L-alanine amidase
VNETPHKRRSLVPKAAIVAGVVIVLLIVGAVAAGVMVHRSRLVEAPDVTGMDSEAALAEIRAADLVARVAGSRVSAEHAADIVLSQRPMAGARVTRGTTVEVVVSAGTQTVAVPDVVGVGLDDASRQLERMGLTVTLKPDSQETSGTAVLEMFPSPGTLLHPGDTVRLTVPGAAAPGHVLLPFALDGVSVLLDPSPGESEEGQDPALEVARRLAALLRASGAEATLTRNSGALAMPQGERVERSAESTAAILVTVDVAPGKRPGITVSYPVNDPEGAAASLARSMTAAMRLPGVRVNTSGTIRDDVLEAFPGIAVRVGLGDPRDASDRARFDDPGWADEVARGLYRGLGEAYGQR